VSNYEPPVIFGATFAISSLAGLAQMLRSGRKITWRAVLSSMLNSGLIGLCIGMFWWDQYGVDNVWFLMGVSLLAGLGGTTALDFILEALKGKIVLKVEKSDDGK